MEEMDGLLPYSVQTGIAISDISSNTRRSLQKLGSGQVKTLKFDGICYILLKHSKHRLMQRPHPLFSCIMKRDQLLQSWHRGGKSII